MPIPRSMVIVSAPPRGTTPQRATTFYASETQCAWSWGLQPAVASIDWVSASAQASIVPQAALEIQMPGGHIFHGITKNVVARVASDGRSTWQDFVDSREYLGWDMAYCCFNKRDSRMVNGIWVRRYWHILPVNFNRLLKTYTPRPYKAWEILDYLFGAPTTETPWFRNNYHPQLNQPVYDVDCLSGKTLGQAVLEVSERVGTVFTLMGGRYSLVWTLKGVGLLPDFPSNSDNRRIGSAISTNPTRLRVLGERNIYQVLNCPMVKDWASGWEAFWNLDDLLFDLYDHEVTNEANGDIPAGTPYKNIPGDEFHQIGNFLAKQRALTITIGEYAALRDARGGGDAFRDFRKSDSRSRMNLPVNLYVRTILFRAFRIPRWFQLRNIEGNFVPLDSMEMVDRSVVEVTHNPVTGEMFYDETLHSASNGYGIAQGYQVGADGFKTLDPKHFKLNEWRRFQNIWQNIPFQIDHSGEGDQFIVFDDPIIRSDNCFVIPKIFDQRSGKLVDQSYVVLNAEAVFFTPAVAASIVFAAEKFSYVRGTGTRDAAENAPGLYAECVAFGNGNWPVEMTYADGFTALEKAREIAASLLNRQFEYQSGGYTVQGSNGTQLSSVIDRVQVRDSAAGLVEEVDFTNERSRSYFEPERDFDRRAQLQTLFPGQAELKVEANQNRLLAAALKQSPQIRRTLAEAFYDRYGKSVETHETVLIEFGSTQPKLAVGTPLFREGNSKLVIAPANSSANADPVFAGVTIREKENPAAPVRVVTGGDVLARVKGPVSTNGSVGFNDGSEGDAFVGITSGVGIALESISHDSIKLIQVRLGSGGGGTGECGPARFS